LNEHYFLISSSFFIYWPIEITFIFTVYVCVFVCMHTLITCLFG
jgi:hypothetical protein